MLQIAAWESFATGTTVSGYQLHTVFNCYQELARIHRRIVHANLVLFSTFLIFILDFKDFFILKMIESGIVAETQPFQNHLSSSHNRTLVETVIGC